MRSIQLSNPLNRMFYGSLSYVTALSVSFAVLKKTLRPLFMDGVQLLQG